MVMVELPVPPGFALMSEDFDRLVEKGTVAKYQQTPRSVLLYLRELSGEKALEVGYGLRATMLEAMPLTNSAQIIRLGILSAWGAITFVMALKWFRWN